MKYRVEINYTSFTFDDGTTAVGFAAIAKENADDKDVMVCITLVNEDEEDNAE